jgi:hypothetical protein
MNNTDTYYKFLAQVDKNATERGNGLASLLSAILCGACEEREQNNSGHFKPCALCEKAYYMFRLAFDTHVELCALKRKHKISDGRRAKSLTEAFEGGMLYWWNPNVLDCGHRGYVQIDDGACLTCINTPKQTAPVVVAPTAPLSTPEQIAAQAAEAQRAKEDAARVEAERKKEQNRARQKRFKANKKKLAEIANKQNENR